MSQPNPLILIHQLCYSLPDGKPLFASLSLTLGTEKTGLVGRNGAGKSTLLKLMLGHLLPAAGSIQVTGTLGYCPQDPPEAANETIADLLGIRSKLEALTHITQGSTDENDFQLIADDWLIEERTYLQLKAFGLDYLPLSCPTAHLSGGEKTRLHLARVFLADSDMILLDEPTNNLDSTARQLLYDKIASWKKGLLVVSHDRTLLNFMNQIVELNPRGVTITGGNYDAYRTQKSLQQAALERELMDAKKLLQQTQNTIQTSREKREQRQSYGRKLFRAGKTDKITAKSRKGRSERTQSRLVTQGDMLLKKAEQQHDKAQSKIEIVPEIHITLPRTAVPHGKTVLAMEQLSFSYASQQHALIDRFSLNVSGPARIALAGKNGSGKTTLVKLILGEYLPSQGSIYRGVEQIRYLDQKITLLDPALSLLENFLRLNPDAKATEAHHALAQFLFRNTAAHKLVAELSGGEKLRAELACVLLSSQPPQLLILDEPTNHLDLDSIASIESALSHYEGALIVISHDQAFLQNIGIEKTITAPFKGD